jgi:hypothetical protein
MKSNEEKIQELLAKHEALGKEIEALRNPKPEFEVGKWYIFNFTTVNGRLKTLLRFEKKCGDTVWYSEAILASGIWKENDYVSYSKKDDVFELADENTVKDALVKEAEKRGFKVGNKIKRDINLMPNCSSGVITLTEECGYNYEFNSDNLNFCGWCIYLKGKWAEIVKEPSLTFGGHEVTIEKEGIVIDIICKGEKGTYGQLKAIYDWVNSKEMMFGSKKLERFDVDGQEYELVTMQAKKVKIGCTWGTMEEIKAILDACEKL